MTAVWIVLYNTAQNSSDNPASYPPDNSHSPVSNGRQGQMNVKRLVKSEFSVTSGNLLEELQDGWSQVASSSDDNDYEP